MRAAPTFTSAQQIELRASPGVVVGEVTDRNGVPVDADVSFGGSKQRVSTGPGGRFRFNDVTPGKYTVAARRVGFFPRTMTAIVGDSGSAVRIALTPLPNRLPSIITEAERGGLSRLVGDTLFGGLADAQIEVVGANRSVKTDSAGEFYVPLNAGKYMVKVSRPNFATRMVSVSIPSSGGKRMQVSAGAGLPRLREEAAARALQARLIRRNAAYSQLFTAEDIEDVGFKSLGQIASSGLVQYVDNSCPVMLPALSEAAQNRGDGSGQRAAVGARRRRHRIRGDYTTKPPRNTQRSIRSGPRTARPSASPKCPQIIAWLKK